MGRKTKYDWDELSAQLTKLASMGFTMLEVAKLLNVTRQTIINQTKRLDITFADGNSSVNDRTTKAKQTLAKAIVGRGGKAKS